MINVIAHDVKASVMLWLDHILLQEGRGFVNWSGNLKNAGQSSFNNLYSYISPQRQWVYDSSVSGAVIPTGVYINNTLSGRDSHTILDFQRGEVLFDTNFNQTVSGNLAYKEVNIYRTNNTEEFLLFDKEFKENKLNFPPYTGYSAGDRTVPCIFVKQNAPSNNIISFERLSTNIHPIRLIFVSNSEWIFQSVCSIISDKKEKNIALLESSQIPFNVYGDLKNNSFNYNDIVSSIQSSGDPNRIARIKDVRISTFTDAVNFLIHPKSVGGFIDLDIEICRRI